MPVTTTLAELTLAPCAVYLQIIQLLFDFVLAKTNRPTADGNDLCAAYLCSKKSSDIAFPLNHIVAMLNREIKLNKSLYLITLSQN